MNKNDTPFVIIENQAMVLYRLWLRGKRDIVCTIILSIGVDAAPLVAKLMLYLRQPRDRARLCEMLIEKAFV